MKPYIQISKFIIIILTLIVVTYTDIKYKTISNKLLKLIIIPGIIINLSINDVTIKNMILGFLFGGGSLFLIAIIFGVGGGDIKLMSVMGLYIGLESTVKALTVAFLLSGFISLGLILFKVKGFKDNIAFGPYLSIGIIISLIVN